MTEQDQELSSGKPQRRIDITVLLWAGILLHAVIFLAYIPGLIYKFQNPDMILKFLGPSYKEFVDQSVWKHLIFMVIDVGLCYFSYELINWKKRGFQGLFTLFMLLIGMSLERENWPILFSDLGLAIIFSLYYVKNEKHLD